MTTPATDYLFDNGTDLGEAQVNSLEALLDGASTDLLSDVVRPGARCLEVGAGNGSIARWLAERSGPSGRVLAVDLDTTRLDSSAHVEVRQHDLNDGLGDPGPFDVIHARLVLLHLPRRQEVLRTLVDALAPGGWLVLGEYGSRLPYGLSAPTEGDVGVFDRVMDIAHHVVGARAGQSLQWAHDLPDHFAAAGLVDVHTREHSRTMTGGDAAARYIHTMGTHILPALAGAGLSESELRRFCDLLLDPGFRAWFYQFLITRGRRA